MKDLVLVIHELPRVREVLIDVVAAAECECSAAQDCAGAMRQIADRRPQLILLCGRLDARSSEGLTMLRRLIAEHAPIPVITIGMPRDGELERRTIVRIIRDAIADAQWQRRLPVPHARAA